MSTKKTTGKEPTTIDLSHVASNLPELTSTFRDSVINKTVSLMQTFTGKLNFELTDIERRRLIKSGIRNYGFLDKASDLALQHEELRPPKFDAEDFKDLIRDLEFIRDVLSLIRGFDRSVSNALFVYGNEAFRKALRFYNSVRELARTGDPDAVAVFNMLRPFFSRPRRTSEEPTEPEMERDVRALLHGKKDGRIVIENEKPHLVGGKHVVVDEAHKAHHGAWKETEKGEIEG